jgi:hypothetical protein
MFRMLTAGLAAALATVLLVPGGAAQARDRELRHELEPRFRMSEPAPVTPPLGLAPPSRRITSEVVLRSGRLYLRGDVDDYSRRLLLVQRKRCGGCAWKRHEVVATGRSGWFRARIHVPAEGSDWWRVRVRASDGYVTSYSAVWETYY